MQIKVKKTDRRFTGHDRYRYYVQLTANPLENASVKEKFFELRAWCWDTWGPAREINQYHCRIGEPYTGDHNKHWAWINDSYSRRLYLGAKEDAALFALKWEY